MEYKCPVCGEVMSWRVCRWGTRTERSGLMVCCSNPAHFRGFCNDRGFVSEFEDKGSIAEVLKARQLLPAT